MNIHGTITENLRAAIASAERLRDHPVYRDTLAYWQELLHEARRQREHVASTDATALANLIVRLESEIAARHD